MKQPRGARFERLLFSNSQSGTLLASRMAHEVPEGAPHPSSHRLESRGRDLARPRVGLVDIPLGERRYAKAGVVLSSGRAKPASRMTTASTTCSQWSFVFMATPKSMSPPMIRPRMATIA